MNPRQSRYYTYVRPIFRSKFAKTYTSIIFSLITILIFSYYALRPTVTTIFSLQKSLDEQTQVLNTLKEKVSNLVAGKANYDNIPPPVISKLNGLVPESPDLPALIDSLSFAAEDAEASISGLQIQPIQLEDKNLPLSKNAEMKQVDFNFNVEGKFVNLMKVLTTLKRLDRLVTISNVNFNQPLDSNLVMSITGKAYYLKN